MAGALLQTKLVAPPARPNLVPRPRLLLQLEQGLVLDQHLTLISAPAGFGKTTLVAEWLAQLDRPAAWLTLDEGENDPARFLVYLIAALQQVDPGLGEAVITLGLSPQPPAPEAYLTILINELATLERPFILFLDDYHVIQNPAVHTQVAFVVENRPPQMHLAIISREDPPLPVARWRARGHVNELRQRDLRFAGQEIVTFLTEVMALNLDPADVTALEKCTEGWIAGLQLAALSMRNQSDLAGFVRSFTGSSRYILDYLVEEVFSHQPTRVQGFLLQTSILERLSGPLCDAVVDGSGSQALLLELERANLLVLPAGHSGAWYRYHRLFAEFLRHRLRASGSQPETLLHRRAAGWFETNGFLEEALKHLLAAQDWSEAQRLIGPAAAAAIRHGQLLTVQSWLAAFPDDVLNRSHDLAALKGFSLLLAGHMGAAGSYVDLALKLIPADPPSSDLGFLTALRSYLAMAQGDVPGALALAREALDYLAEDDPYYLRGAVLSSLGQALVQLGDLDQATQVFQRIIALSHQAGQPLFAVGAMSQLAYILQTQGRRVEALALAQEVVALCVSRRGNPLPVSGLAHTILGLLYMEADELELARSHLLQAQNFGDQMGLASGIPHTARIMLARLHLATAETVAARTAIDEARQIAGQMKSRHVAFVVAGAEAELRFRQGDFAALEQLIERYALSPVGLPSHASEVHYLTFARFLLAQNRLPEAETLLHSLEQFAQSGGRQRAMITIHILFALLRRAQAAEELALRRLEKALRLAAPEGYRRAFLEQDQALFTLLPKVRQVAPAFVDRLLEDAPMAPERAPHGRQQPLLDPLSDRELEVLGLIAAGLSNREIADRLYITVGTVKTHAHTIYGKLGVSGRTQAVARARELELL